MQDFTTDTDKMMEAAVRLAEGGDVASEGLTSFESGSHIPADAYGGTALPVGPIPPQWDMQTPLGELMTGPYATARLYMIDTLSRTSMVMRANAAALVEAAEAYREEEAQNMDRYREIGEK